jgi:hypothetical protein
VGSRGHARWVYHLSLRLVALMTARTPPTPASEWAAVLDRALQYAANAGDAAGQVRMLTAKMRTLVATGAHDARPAALALFRQAHALFRDEADATLPVKSQTYVQFAIPAVATLLTMGEVREAQAMLDVLTGLMQAESAAPLPAHADDYAMLVDAHKYAAVYLLAGICRVTSAAEQALQFLNLGISCTDRT